MTRRSCRAATSALVALAAVWPLAAAAQALTQADIGGVIARVVSEANARDTPATIAVTDRSGAVLAVYQMAGAPQTFEIIHNPNGPDGGLNGTALPATLEAISKAVTAAYLSSSNGNAFSTRTASQIIQNHFNPGTLNAPSGPLSGVQFSSLPCSDLVVRLAPDDPTTLTRGPHGAPLGLAGDPGGLPLYKNGALVGGVGVKAAGVYGLDLNIHANDNNTDEILALAGTIGLDAPANLRADQITVGGLLLRYTDATPSELVAPAANAPAYTALPPLLVDVPGYYSRTSGIRVGSAYGTAPFGLAPDTSGQISTTTPAYLLVDQNGQSRYPPAPGAGRAALSTREALTLLRNAYAIAVQARAQIRNVPGAHAAVTISIVDATGNILGIVTVPDAPMFGIDVALQKARSAAFMSSPSAARDLRATGLGSFVNLSNKDFHFTPFTGDFAWSARALGTMARDSLPDGIDGTPNGPLALPADQYTPFNDGLQLDLVVGNLTSAAPQSFCTALPPTPGNRSNAPPLANGLQIFPGGFPIYRRNILVGGIGVSGDGVDQDDLIAFLGLYNAGRELHTGIGEAPFRIRASTLAAHRVSPKYVNCPYAPFLNSASHNVCSGK